MICRFIIVIAVLLIGCNSKVEKIKPTLEPITESIYASGIIKSKNQYQANALVNGIIDFVYVAEGDSVRIGSPLVSISNETQKLNKENAELNAAFNTINSNQGKINEAQSAVELAKHKMKLDSSLYYRQKSLWQQQIGSKSELEQRELTYQNSKNLYYSSLIRLADLKKQLNFSAMQSQKNLLIADKLTSEYTVKSEIKGVIYSITKSRGELVGPQSPIAIIGDASNFILEMQVDELDILKIKKGLQVLVTLESYKGKVFEAKVTKINPIMNERSKTFIIEAEFIEKPEILYPNISFEANIVIQIKKEALLIPRNYLINDSFVFNSQGKKISVKTGLKDYQKIEILNGLKVSDEIILPTE
jgi:HlyD family secretion protein